MIPYPIIAITETTRVRHTQTKTLGRMLVVNRGFRTVRVWSPPRPYDLDARVFPRVLPAAPYRHFVEQWGKAEAAAERQHAALLRAGAKHHIHDEYIMDDVKALSDLRLLMGEELPESDIPPEKAYRK